MLDHVVWREDLEEEAERSESVPQRTLRTLIGGCCGGCKERYTAREAVLSIYLGLKNSPQCMNCVSRTLKRPALQLWSDLEAAVQGRECYLKAWRDADLIDGVSEVILHVTTIPEGIRELTSEAVSPQAMDHWYAGDLGCGELVMELRLRLQSLDPGSILQVTATDPAAPEDLPAWCRLCGHTLIAYNHPVYWIRRKGDNPCQANSV